MMIFFGNKNFVSDLRVFNSLGTSQTRYFWTQETLWATSLFVKFIVELKMSEVIQAGQAVKDPWIFLISNFSSYMTANK